MRGNNYVAKTVRGLDGGEAWCTSSEHVGCSCSCRKRRRFTENLACGPGWDLEESDETERQGCTYVAKQVIARYIHR